MRGNCSALTEVTLPGPVAEDVSQFRRAGPLAFPPGR